ncbi:LSU ribosomal protein L15P [Desulfocapsa sulfexigens DSM 10523]|uniref:Large ribosomal subunit protein uL15 n=1 Tax=Desulfocapsa sulfexigens (strain DSM 10523 / SB164P1) TaxID=1167006 RepID=M1NG23_DESSD|nr:50S ribosomal protein L15 [Desulfocapsa sulfexigens]AGF78609.1 LSU ribosomal protein L15P [Desulfocapsa sulfexigens DSM 10523]
MINLGNLSPNKGANRQRKRLGRGPGTGHGKTAGRGHKGFKSRSGSGVKPGFEGGQMPLQRRLPKRGFTNINTVKFSIISLSQLEKFDFDGEITTATLVEHGFARSGRPVKILANGDINKAITVAVEKVSGGAKAKIEAAGGKVVVTEIK